MKRKKQDLAPQSNKVELLFVPVGGAVVPPEEYSHSAHLQGLKGQKVFPIYSNLKQKYLENCRIH